MSISIFVASQGRSWLCCCLAVSCAVAFPSAAAPCIANKAASDDPLARLIAAEHAFAADVQKMGINLGFREHAAADSILLRDEPVPALEQLSRESDDPSMQLEWQPTMGAVSRSNDLGFTTGPYSLTRGGKLLYGQFLTIWARGEDGRWRWFLDHGLPPVGEARPVVKIGPSRDLGGRTCGGGMRQLAHVEEALNKAVVVGDWTATLRLLADDAVVLRPRLGALSRPEAARQLPGRPGFAKAERLGMRLARSGDLAISYGRLTRPPDKPGAYYVRVWRRESAQWRLLIDEIA